jgi:hypothetical protein
MNAAIHRRLTIIENKLRKCCGEELLTVTGELSSPVETATPMVTPIFATPPLKKKNKKGKSKKAKKPKRGGAAKSRKMKGG